jgi:osmotically-inducible protein OsmY
MEERATTIPKPAAGGVSLPTRIDEPCPASRLKLASELAQRVRHEASGHVRGLVVEVHDDCVVLAGKAPSFYHKQLAQHAVMKHLGERQLDNRIEVIWSAAAFLD